MPSNNNTPSSRNLRSNSQSDLTLANIKALIDTSKSEIISSFRIELQSLKETVSLLSSRVEELEKENEALKNDRRVSHDSGPNISNFEDFFSSVVGELQMRERRRLNIMIAGAEETKSGSIAERKAADTEYCQHLFETIGVSPITIKDVSRIGKLVDGRKRLLKVSLDSDDSKRCILTSAKQLRKSEAYRNVFVKPDLTPFQQELDYRLRMELRDRKNADPDKEFVISNGKVVERNTFRGFRKDF